jgi:hypothetical protein
MRAFAPEIFGGKRCVVIQHARCAAPAWQGRRFALPLHPTRAGSVSPPPCTPRRGTRPGSSTFAQPYADWMRGNGVSRCIDSQGLSHPRHPTTKGPCPWNPRQAFAPDTTTSAMPRWTRSRGHAAPAPRIRSSDGIMSDAPAVIYLPDQSQPEPARKTRRSGRMKGRHFGPRPVDDPRSARLDVRCTPGFRTKVLADAQAAGLSLSAFICAKLGEGPSPRSHRAAPGPDVRMLARVLAELGKCGSNLNQIARQMNSGEDVPASELHTTIREHREAVALVMAALEG